MNIIKSIVALAAMLACLLSTEIQAKKHKIVLVHGLQPEQLISGGDIAEGGENYWQGYWNALSDDRIDWPSYERIEQKIATEYVWPKLKHYAETNFCSPGCIFVTHSTGDLVTRYIIENNKCG